MHKWLMISGTIFLMFSVILGAFAAHGLKSRISEYSLGVFQTGVHYQAIHGIALILCGIFAFQLNNQFNQTPFWINLSAILFSFGILLFSGSLYALALTSQKWLGPITPIGGLFFIAGWCCFAIGIFKS